MHTTLRHRRLKIILMILGIQFIVILPLVSAQEAILQQDQLVVRTPVGPFLLKDLRVNLFRGSTGQVSSATFQGEVWNNSTKGWSRLVFGADMRDASGAKLNPFPYQILMGSLGKGEMRTFSIDLPSATVQSISKYEIDLLEGEFPVKYRFIMTAPKPNSSLSFDDQAIRITFQIQKQQITFALQNRSAAPIKIDWNNLSYVDLSGRAQRIMHEGVKFIDRDKPQASTVIPPGARVEDLIYPANYVRWSSALNKWIEEPLFPDGPLGLKLKGTEFGIFMPLEVAGKTVNYNFRFRIQSVE